MYKENQFKIGILCSDSIETHPYLLNLIPELSLFLNKQFISINFYGENKGLNFEISKTLCDNKYNFYNTQATEQNNFYISSDIFILLPCNYSSLEQFFYVIRKNKELNLNKTIIVYDYRNYFSLLLNWLEESTNFKMIENCSEYFCIAQSVHDIEYFFPS